MDIQVVPFDQLNIALIDFLHTILNFIILRFAQHRTDQDNLEPVNCLEQIILILFSLKISELCRVIRVDLFDQCTDTH